MELNALFTGVITNPHALEIFIRKGADAIVDDINLLLRLVERNILETILTCPYRIRLNQLGEIENMRGFYEINRACGRICLSS